MATAVGNLLRCQTFKQRVKSGLRTRGWADTDSGELSWRTAANTAIYYCRPAGRAVGDAPADGRAAVPNTTTEASISGGGGYIEWVQYSKSAGYRFKLVLHTDIGLVSTDVQRGKRTC